MSNAQHTPGPWETLTFSNHELQTDFAMVKIGGRVHMVGYSDEDKANARLIAAAPELLDALKLLLEHAEGLIAEEYPKSMHKEQMAQFDSYRAAIAKATGGAA